MEQLQAVGHQLGLDYTFIPLFVMMYVLYFILSAVYLKPFQHILHNRKEKTSGAKEEAAELIEKAENMMSQYMASIKGARDKARAENSEVEKNAKAEETKILSEASMKAKVFLQNANAETENQKRTALNEVSKDLPLIANEIVALVLGRRA